MDIDLEQNLEGCRSSRDDDDNVLESCELVDEHNLNTTTSDFTTSGRLNDKLVMYEPQTGLEFETKEEAYAYYREYARSVGFGITIKASRRSKKTSKFIDVKVACSRFGTKRESSTTMNPRSCMKTNCKAGMQMKRTREGKWIIYSIVKEHNHKICPDDFYNGLRGQKKQPVAVSCQKKGLQLALEEGDARIMLDHFSDMQAENPDFFYSVDFNHEKFIRTVFWVHAKGKHDYNSFSDVVFFDTFYVKNKYKVPFTPFIGVDHNMQFILLGGALIGEESKSAMVWLMKTWLKAVGGETPKVFITDQDDILNEAVADVFPVTKHFYSLWHIFSKIPDNLSFLNDQQGNFILQFNKCVFQSWTGEQFEDEWWKMVENFDLRENGWIHTLYGSREKWAPAYMRGTSLAGMSVAERSGSINSFFDKYMLKDATFRDFFQQYVKFVADMNEFETEADFKTDNGPLSTFETQMSSVYTEAVFRKFQVEFLGMVSCQLQKESEDDGHVIFRVDDFAGCQNSFVIWNEAELEICCSCYSFEYKGFLCKHAMLVLQMSGISNIPSQYILKRWTKYAMLGHNIRGVSNSRLHKAQRFNDICKLAVKLGEEGSLSQEAYSIACQALETAFKHCVDENTFGKHVLGYDSYANEVEKICKVGSKKPKKKKYRKREAHIEPEGPAKRLQDSCMQMEQSNSRAHNCYIAEQNAHGMELSNRNHPHGGYYGSQQTTQGMDGILEPVSPIHESYFLNQLGGHELIHSVVTNISHYGIQHRQPATVLASVNLPVSSDYQKSRGHIEKDHLADSVPLAGNGSQEERSHYLYEEGLHH